MNYFTKLFQLYKTKTLHRLFDFCCTYLSYFSYIRVKKERHGALTHLITFLYFPGVFGGIMIELQAFYSTFEQFQSQYSHMPHGFAMILQDSISFLLISQVSSLRSCLYLASSAYTKQEETILSLH